MNSSTYLIAYFDILGYTDIVSNKTTEDEINLVKGMKEIVNSINDLNNNHFQISVHTFSDNYVIAIEISNNNDSEKVHKAMFMINSLQRIQHQIILDHGLLIRGALTKGDLYIDSNFIHGKALIKAHNLEKEAIYPRIIIDNELIGEIEAFRHISSTSPEDFFLDMLENQKYIDNTETEPRYMYELIPFIQCFDDVFFINYLIGNSKTQDKFNAKHADVIIKGLYKHYGNKRVSEKYIWLCNYHNMQCSDGAYIDTSNIKELYQDAEL